jgi:parallel beta-helix repeat protein
MEALLLIGVLAFALNIQPVRASGTIYIRADGSIDPPSAPISTVDNVTYTLTGDIYDSIVIERDNIMVDGAGYSLRGTGDETGIKLYERRNVTISNTLIAEFFAGVWLEKSSYNTVSGNSIMDNYFGIILDYSSCNNIVSEDDVSSNEIALVLDSSSDNNIVSGNNVAGNDGYGIRIEYSSNNTLRSNSMITNRYNFGVDGGGLSEFVNDVDVSNTVDGKPIYYWLNMRDKAVPLDAGYVALVNCTNMAVQNLILARNLEGPVLADTTNTTVSGNSITNNYNGIVLSFSSDNNTVSENTVTANEGCGITLSSSNNNTILRNQITSNTGGGIELYGSSNNNVVSGNQITGSSFSGIFLWISSNNSISENNIEANQWCGIGLDSSSNNRIYHNNFRENGEQVHIQGTTSANVFDDGYPSGGNYWSDYSNSDSFFGSYQNLTGNDGIGDTPYVFDENNTDNYPLMSPYEYWANPIAGDVNRDMKVSLSDITQILDGFGSTNGSDGYYWHKLSCIFCPHYFGLDIDNDNKIALSDITTTLDNFGETYP